MNKFDKAKEIMNILNLKNMRDVDIKYLGLTDKYGITLEKIEIRKEYELHYGIMDGNYDTITFLANMKGKKKLVRLRVSIIDDDNIDKIYNWVKELC